MGTFNPMLIIQAEHKTSARPVPPLSYHLAFDVAATAVTWIYAVALPNDPRLTNFTLATSTLVATVYALILREKSNWSNLTNEASVILDQAETYGFWSRCFFVSLLCRNLWVYSINLKSFTSIPRVQNLQKAVT